MVYKSMIETQRKLILFDFYLYSRGKKSKADNKEIWIKSPDMANIYHVIFVNNNNRCGSNRNSMAIANNNYLPKVYHIPNKVLRHLQYYFT